jgi:hypothetical protein
MDKAKSIRKKDSMMSILWVALFVLAWVFLQAYLLPKMGIST